MNDDSFYLRKLNLTLFVHQDKEIVSTAQFPSSLYVQEVKRWEEVRNMVTEDMQREKVCLCVHKQWNVCLCPACPYMSVCLPL